jgi:DNA-binding NtrC family response regulator
MSLPTQAKLLRALQEREITRVGGKDTIRIDVRFVSATHRDLPGMIAEKMFREDLYYRLHVVHVALPPLRERKGDVALLASHFLDDLNDKYTKGFEKSFAPGVLATLETLPWRGNVRELHNEIERAFVVSGAGERVLRLTHFGMEASNVDFGAKETPDSRQTSSATGVIPTQPKASPDFASPALRVESEAGTLQGDELRLTCRGKGLMDVIDAAERLLVMASLAKHHGNKTKAAESLGISREGMRKMLARWGENA